MISKVTASSSIRLTDGNVTGSFVVDRSIPSYVYMFKSIWSSELHTPN